MKNDDDGTIHEITRNFTKTASQFSVYFVWVRGSSASLPFQQPAREDLVSKVVALILKLIVARRKRLVFNCDCTKP